MREHRIRINGRDRVRRSLLPRKSNLLTWLGASGESRVSAAGRTRRGEERSDLRGPDSRTASLVLTIVCNALFNLIDRSVDVLNRGRAVAPFGRGAGLNFGAGLAQKLKRSLHVRLIGLHRSCIHGSEDCHYGQSSF